MKRRAWCLLGRVGVVGVVGMVVGTGCKTSDNPDMPVELGDGGGINRNVTDGARRGDASGSGDGSAAMDAPAGVKLTLTIITPVANAIVATTGFKPAADVVVESTNGDALDAVQTVVADLFPSGMADVPGSILATVVLDQASKEDQSPTRAVYHFGGNRPLVLGALKSGSYDLLVSATSVHGATANATVSVQVDAGPSITVLTPQEGDFKKGAVNVSVIIDDALFTPIQNISMTLGKVPLVFTGPTGSGNNEYNANVDFSTFDPPLDGEQLIVIRAQNKNGTETVVQRKFVVDNQGPVLSNTSPKNGDLIGQIIAIQAQVSDPAGVVDQSVVAVIQHGGTDFVVELNPPLAGAMPPLYTARFDTRLLSPHALFPTISFRASDTLGNENTATYGLRLDNTPPLSDLDPPRDMRGLFKNGTTIYCSWPFDPVGEDAIDDGDYTYQLFDIRARVEDQGNQPLAGTADAVPIAAVPAGNVRLLALSDVSKPLVVDTNGDGVCDSINPLLRPQTTPMSSSDALAIEMAPLTPSTTADVTPDPSISCGQGTGTALPDPVCDTVSDPSKARWYGNVPHSYQTTMFTPYAAAGLPAIWTIPPIVADKLLCGGTQFDALGNSVPDGWVCLAVEASDALGNSQVSRILRVCVDKDGQGNECPHQRLVAVSATTPVVVTTAAAHGYATGDTVVVSGVVGQSQVNGTWAVNVTSPTTFQLVGSAGFPQQGVASGGWVVLRSQLPDCTGTQSAKGPPPTITNTPCRPWSAYPQGEFRAYY